MGAATPSNRTLTYAQFLDSKRRDWSGAGIELSFDALPPVLFPFQRQLARWALRKGRAAIWADTGLGKTWMQLAWADRIPGRVLILAPLCVAHQTIAEGQKCGVEVVPFGTGGQIEITNYEQLHHVDPRDYDGVVLDESSILKSLDGKTRTRLIRVFERTPYRLCCTATPAPNDIAELANHSEFLGIMTRAEMLATFFVHDNTIWRLKRHAIGPFYRWLATWGMFLRRPSDLGFDDTGYDLPPLRIHDSVVDCKQPIGDYLFPGMGLGGIGGRSAARKASLSERIAAALAIITADSSPCIVWCGLNDEQEAIARVLGDRCVSIAGHDSIADKEHRMDAFVSGRVPILVTKVRIAGFGMNLQHCARMVFVGLGDSYEQYYQAIRRCWRFGQTRPVDVHVVVSTGERVIVENVRRKEGEAAAISAALIAHMAEVEKEEIGVTQKQSAIYRREVAHGNGWEMRLGDSCEELPTLADNSVDFSVYSPPFISLYTYTASERDVGNCSTREEFLDHLRFIVGEMLRVTKPGRLTACHIAQVTSTKATHGVIGLIDLRGAVTQLFQDVGWIYHGDITVDKDPQAQAIRTKSKALLFVQLRKDSSWLRPALADYILVFRKPGDNAVPIAPDITNEEWIHWARPVWYGVRETRTLNAAEGRGNDDERHICPLQLDVIERCIRLWSNPGELVLSPFAGIGSEGYEAVRLDRRYLGIELKEEYWRAAVRNLQTMERGVRAQTSLFPIVTEAHA